MVDGGVLRPGLCGEEYESRICDTAIQAGGFVVKMVTATGHIDLCGADERVYAVTTKSTKEFIGDGYGGGAWTAVVTKPTQLQREGEALVQLLPANVPIVYGDTLQSTAGGTVDLVTYAGATPTLVELRSVVGRALETKGNAVGGVIKVMLAIQHC